MLLQKYPIRMIYGNWVRREKKFEGLFGCKKYRLISPLSSKDNKFESDFLYSTRAWVSGKNPFQVVLVGAIVKKSVQQFGVFSKKKKKKNTNRPGTATVEDSKFPFCERYWWDLAYEMDLKWFGSHFWYWKNKRIWSFFEPESQNFFPQL